MRARQALGLQKACMCIMGCQCAEVESLRAGVLSRTGHRCHRLRPAHSHHSSPGLGAAPSAAHARRLIR